MHKYSYSIIIFAENLEVCGIMYFFAIQEKETIFSNRMQFCIVVEVLGIYSQGWTIPLLSLLRGSTSCHSGKKTTESQGAGAYKLVITVGIRIKRVRKWIFDNSYLFMVFYLSFLFIYLFIY